MNMPAYIDNAFDNLEDVMHAMSDEGLQDLNVLENKFSKVKITRFGVLVEMRNRDEKPFSVLVMDDADMNTFRKRITTSAKAMKKKNRF
jgi:hypothetical protein